MRALADDIIRAPPLGAWQSPFKASAQARSISALAGHLCILS